MMIDLSKQEIDEILFCLARVQEIAYSESEFRRSIMIKLRKSKEVNNISNTK